MEKNCKRVKLLPGGVNLNVFLCLLVILPVYVLLDHFEVQLKSACQLPSLLTDITITHFTKSHYLFILAEWLTLWQHLARPPHRYVSFYCSKNLMSHNALSSDSLMSPPNIHTRRNMTKTAKSMDIYSGCSPSSEQVSFQ